MRKGKRSISPRMKYGHAKTSLLSPKVNCTHHDVTRESFSRGLSIKKARAYYSSINHPNTNQKCLWNWSKHVLFVIPKICQKIQLSSWHFVANYSWFLSKIHCHTNKVNILNIVGIKYSRRGGLGVECSLHVTIRWIESCLAMFIWFYDKKGIYPL